LTTVIVTFLFDVSQSHIATISGGEETREHYKTATLNYFGSFYPITMTNGPN